MSLLFIRHLLPNGQQGAISTVLSNILLNAEIRYGPRDHSYTILGVEVNHDGHPRTYFPYDKHILIQVSTNCINDFNRGVYQVAHEAIHCLSPVKYGEGSVLEEGLATLFSREYTQSMGYGNWTGSGNYLEAESLVSSLLQFDPDIIKKVRNVQPTISSITAEQLIAINGDIPIDLALALTKKFINQ
jgi:hypothetical protein